MLNPMMVTVRVVLKLLFGHDQSPLFEFFGDGHSRVLEARIEELAEISATCDYLPHLTVVVAGGGVPILLTSFATSSRSFHRASVRTAARQGARPHAGKNNVQKRSLGKSNWGKMKSKVTK